MATFANQSKNSSTITNLTAVGRQNWDDSTIGWAGATGYWDGAFAWDNGTKNSSSLTNQTKN